MHLRRFERRRDQQSANDNSKTETLISQRQWEALDAWSKELAPHEDAERLERAKLFEQNDGNDGLGRPART
jgi:hypothetical protein